MTNAPFKPTKGFSASLTTSDATVSTDSKNTNCYRIYNASAADLLIKPSYMAEYVVLSAWKTELFSFSINETFTAKLSTGTGSVYITCGEGV